MKTVTEALMQEFCVKLKCRGRTNRRTRSFRGNTLSLIGDRHYLANAYRFLYEKIRPEARGRILMAPTDVMLQLPPGYDDGNEALSRSNARRGRIDIVIPEGSGANEDREHVAGLMGSSSPSTVPELPVPDACAITQDVINRESSRAAQHHEHGPDTAHQPLYCHTLAPSEEMRFRDAVQLAATRLQAPCPETSYINMLTH